MENKTTSDLIENLNEKEGLSALKLLRSSSEYRRILPTTLYKVGEALVAIQAGFTAWGFFIGLDKLGFALSALVAFFGIGFLVRHMSDTPKQNQWIIIKLALASLCLLIQLLLSVKGSPFLCV